jgi:polysaccharide deacetylase family protein (PEP-CTERM system associated)
MNPTILFTVDVEDWFQVENFKPWVPFSTWSSYKLRVEKNTHRLLDLFDSVDFNNEQQTIGNTRTQKLRATFFVLGWIAEHLPHLVREIFARGHEVASHGYHHHLCRKQSHENLKNDLADSKKLLEDIIGAPVQGYRAPSFSIDERTMKIIEDRGYRYDSSYNSFEMHGRYGKLSIHGYPKKGIAYQISESFHELPISNLQFDLQTSNFKLQHLTFPWGGGGYFRLIPLPIFKAGVKAVLRKEKVYLFYIHPWEIDVGQPKMNKASAFYRFRHYANLEKNYSKLFKFLRAFNYCRFVTCREYLKQI